MGLLLTFSVAALLPPGGALPPLKGEFLTGRMAVLPDAARGKVSLLAFGFTYDSRFAVEAWVKAFRADFGRDVRAGFSEIPMIGGPARLGKWFIDSGMRRGTPKADHEHVITVYGGVAPWKERLGYRSPKDAYLVLLDPQGRVLWRHNGVFDEKAYGDLQRHTKAALQQL